MSQFIIRRILYSIVTLCILSGTIFLMVRLTGDPVALMAEASARPEDLERIRHQWGLDRSWPVQYVTFMQNALTGRAGQVLQLSAARQRALLPAPAQLAAPWGWPRRSSPF